MLCANENLGADFSAEIAVVTGDVPAGASADDALESIRLVMLSNAITLRNVTHSVQSQAAASFSPVAVTLDELGDAWDKCSVHLTVQVAWNGRNVGMCDAGTDMTHHFGQIVAYASKTRALRAGTVVSSGTVSNAGFEKNGTTEWPKGYSCIAEKRAIETILDGKASTDFMQFGDTVRIEIKGRDGQSVFGAIDQTISPLKAG